jgi:hypothetical protein
MTTWYRAGRILTTDADVLIIRPSVMRHCKNLWPLLTEFAAWEATFVADVAPVVALPLQPVLHACRAELLHAFAAMAPLAFILASLIEVWHLLNRTL